MQKICNFFAQHATNMQQICNICAIYVQNRRMTYPSWQSHRAGAVGCQFEPHITTSHGYSLSMIFARNVQHVCKKKCKKNVKNVPKMCTIRKIAKKYEKYEKNI